MDQSRGYGANRNMIFFTRELYLGYQPKSGRERAAMREWRRNGEIYHVYRHVIKPLLPRRIVQIANGSLHDAVVRRVVQAKGKLELTLDTSGSFSRFRPHPIRLTFTGLRKRVPIRGLVGQWWLYDEIHLSPRSRFNLQVLFTDSELEIEADDVKLERAKSG